MLVDDDFLHELALVQRPSGLVVDLDLLGGGYRLDDGRDQGGLRDVDHRDAEPTPEPHDAGPHRLGHGRLGVRVLEPEEEPGQRVAVDRVDLVFFVPVFTIPVLDPVPVQGVGLDSFPRPLSERELQDLVVLGGVTPSRASAFLDHARDLPMLAPCGYVEPVQDLGQLPGPLPLLGPLDGLERALRNRLLNLGLQPRP